MQNIDIERLTKKAFPMLIERLSMDSQVEGINIFSDIDFTLGLGLTSKINVFKSNTDKLIRGEDVIESYITSTQFKQETVVIYNPLFPFVSITKIYQLFQRVNEGIANSGIGSYFNAQGLREENIPTSSDRGIFAVVNREKFLQRKSRLIFPIDTVSLSALELVSLRAEEDYELYGLIVNAGLV